jgi:hypothetical protein
MGNRARGWEGELTRTQRTKTVTQARVSSDLHPALPTSSPVQGIHARPGLSSDPALWLIALTASGLVLSAVLLLGLLARNMLRDASIGGFVSAVAIIIATIGIGALAYVLVTAKREGWLNSPDATTSGTAPEVPNGMHVVPATPSRSRPVAQPSQPAAWTAPRPVPARPAAAQVPHPAPTRTARRVAEHTGPPALASTRPAAPPPIRMPLPTGYPPRRPAWPMAAPVIRMPAPRMDPHAQAALYQVNAAIIRTPTALWRR